MNSTIVTDDIYCSRCRRLCFDRSHLTSDEIQNPYPFVPLDYVLEDILPDLPTLTKSARAGCQLCEFLKYAIIRHCNITAGLSSEVSQNLMLRLDRFYQLGSPWFWPEPAPNYISGEVILGGAVSEIKIETVAKPRGEAEYLSCISRG
jgi:hypothetical protein